MAPNSNRALSGKESAGQPEVPRDQENLSGKDLNEQSRENWVPAGAQSGHEGDEQSGVNWVTTRASGHEGKEQSVAGQAVDRTYSF